MTDLQIVEAGVSPLSVPVGAMTDDELKAEAVTLKIAIDLGERRTREWRLRLGEVLAEIRSRVRKEGGNWLPYVAEQLPIEQAQASNYMRLAANSQRVMSLPPGLSMREELVALRKPLEPKPRPEYVNGEAPTSPLLRFMPPELSVAAVVRLILLTVFEDAETALDMTYGSGNFWDGTAPVRVLAHDSLPERALDGVADFTDMRELYDDASIDVPLFDPPHNADAGADSIMGERFGTVRGQAQLDQLILDGVREAWRICRLGIIVKVCDQTHGQLFQSETDLVCEALAVDGRWGRPYEVVHHVTRWHGITPKTQDEHYSALNNGATYLIFRKGDQRHKSHRRQE